MPWCPRWGLFTSCLWTPREAADGSDAPQWPGANETWNADFGRCLLLPSRQAMRDVCFGEMLGCELQFSPAIGGKDWKAKFFCILSSWIHRVDDEDQSWAIGPKRLTETWFWVTARFCYQGWAARWLKSTPHPHLLALHPRRQDNYQNHPSFQISAGYL